MSTLTWRRGEFAVALRPVRTRDGNVLLVTDTRSGSVSACGTWGIDRLPRSWSLTYLLTGRRVTDKLDRLRDAKQLAEILTPLVQAVQLPELSDVWQITDAVADAVRPTMVEWTRRRDD